MRHENFKQETTGSLMKDNFIIIKMHFTVGEAIRYLRNYVPYNTNINYGNINYYDEVVIEAVSLPELLRFQHVAIIIVTDLVTFPQDPDHEVAAQVYRNTDLISMPVVNNHNQL